MDVMYDQSLHGSVQRWHKSRVLDCCQVLLAVLCDELLRVLLKDVPVVLVLVGNSTFDGIIRLGRSEDLTDEHQDVADLVWGLPLVGTEHA